VIFGFGISGFYKHAAELFEDFWVVNHLRGGIYDRSQSPAGGRELLSGVFGVFVSQGAPSSFAEWLRFYVAEI